ncbi:hypothetical protein AAVH_42835, partial [Aphelenchoides avenae]
MLPAETFADVVSFLGYYDLGGLKLANKLFSARAQQCADAIRLFDFSDFEFEINDRFTVVERLEPEGSSHEVCTLEHASVESFAEFVAEAFRNCAVGRLTLVTRPKHVLNALRSVADTVTVAGTLDIHRCFNAQELIECADSFRQVK